MRRVYKYYMPMPGTETPVRVPAEYEVVHVGIQGQSIVLWAEGEDNDITVSRNFITSPTGSNIPDGAKHQGTVIDGEFVWHVYLL